MKKIMFNDKFLLTQAVLEGRKTQTRRMITYPKKFHGKDVWGYYVYRRATGGAITEICMYDENEISIDEGQILPKYKVGEVVAVAQSYCSIAEELENCNNATCAAHYEKNVQKASEYISWMEHPGFNNKMFVVADMMIHQIRITDVRVEKLQDIQEEDCLKEGINEFDTHSTANGKAYTFDGINESYKTPREAFAELINRVSRKDVWSLNPYVFVYDFELVK